MNRTYTVAYLSIHQCQLEPLALGWTTFTSTCDAQYLDLHQRLLPIAAGPFPQPVLLTDVSLHGEH